MYLPEHFKEDDLDQIKSIVEHFPLATCVSSIGDDFEVNHFPMIWRGDKLIGHIAFANRMHEALKDGCKAVFIFKAEDSYIRPIGIQPKHSIISMCQLGITKSSICTVNCTLSITIRKKLRLLDC